MTKKPTFRRYTNLAAAIHLLRTRQITLLDPATWDDKNDSYFMSEYKTIVKAKTVLAVCFAQTKETYHHWRVFSNGSDGVCIEFSRDELLSAFDGDDRITKKDVSYHYIDELKRQGRIEPEALLFLKRKPYEPEAEYRVVYVDYNDELMARTFSIEIACIRRITLSPWMHSSLRDSVAETLRDIPGCEKVEISRSTLVGNREWQALTELARLQPSEIRASEVDSS